MPDVSAASRASIPVVLLLSSVVAGAGAPAVAHADVPRLSLRTGGSVGEAKKTSARAELRAARGSFRGRIGIELRGTASARAAKPSYTFETRGSRGSKGRPVGLLGMPADSDWILDADLRDRSATRNAVAYATSRRIGRWAPRTRHVELFLNGRYRGLYLLAERPELDKTRVVEPRGGGVLLELSDDAQKADFTSAATRRTYQHHDPTSGDLSAKKERAVEAAVREAERAVYAGTSRQGRLDDAAAIDHLLLQELFRNQDALRRSTYLTVADSGHVVFGPIFDLDRSMGSTTDPGASGPEGWITTPRAWGEALSRDPAFAAAFGARWRALRATTLLQSELLARVDAVDREVAAARARDLRRWPIAQEELTSADVPALKRWLTARIAWMDAQIDTWGVRAG